MIFQSLYEAMQRKELILIDGGFCRFHRRADGQLTILEILSSKPGAGSAILKQLEAMKPFYILAKCPTELPANEWYKKKGFKLIRQEQTKSGKYLNVWVK